ncbi:FtsW/RodA/SpoVE family cell cycle protein [Listeria kieliensis]|uniref:Cell division protein FtsW n=1 Tax=Listeria kieliensis TaxID=1621700 RepID=A0A3D8TU61_9LIST|nr:FtsW/RodA/SpoVE family cell cycle protein [Listeria kieliensis]RDX02187.1 cell division protein FtsW [Listeria kieliensis]
MTTNQKILLQLLFFLSIASCIAIYFAEQTGQYSTNFLFQQILFLAISSVVCFVLSKWPLQSIRKWLWLIYPIFILLLIGLQFTTETNGARRWYKLLGFSFQPTEILKSFFILALAAVAVRYEKKPAKQILALTLTAVPILFLIFREPDLGSTIVYFVTFFAILLIANASRKWIFTLLLSAFTVFSAIFYVVFYHLEWLRVVGLEPYQFARILSWIDPSSDPSASYQVNLSLVAVGSGGMSGRSGQIYIPESHTDMIFSTIANQFGFIGASLLLFLFLLFIQVLIRFALDAKTRFSVYIYTGFAVYFAFNIFENIAMTIGLMPLTGIPLPFISYGGSSVLGNFIAIGILLAVSRYEKEYAQSLSSN